MGFELLVGTEIDKYNVMLKYIIIIKRALYAFN